MSKEHQSYKRRKVYLKKYGGKPILEPVVLKVRDTKKKQPRYMRKRALKKRGLFYE